MNNIIWIILDSCRYDSFVSARTPNFNKIGKTEKRFSYASWTSPAHFTFLMGLLPHHSPKRVFASAVYKNEFACWQQRINNPSEVKFEEFLPEFNLVKFLNTLGYRTIGRVSLPVLNPGTLISHYFYDYRLMDNHNSFLKMIDGIDFRNDQPTFYFLNLGETHYPYMLDDRNLPHISGLHGIIKNFPDTSNDKRKNQRAGKDLIFKQEILDKLKKQQVKAVEYCDSVFAELLKKCPFNTYFIITSDHGELFGEDGYFGHGPIMHEKVFEVPLVEGKLPTSLS
jgi:hypothetical protein